VIQTGTGKIYWNYFLALERDLEVVSRYIEFDQRNLSVFSIELAHLLFAAASEVDVIAKALCQILNPSARRENITDYQAVLVPALPELITDHVDIPRYGLRMVPWANWQQGNNPAWWKSYNKVKHERDSYFHEATLQNAIDALSALLLLVFQYYSYTLSPPVGPVYRPKHITQQLGRAKQ
jgi:hypothetical protein